MRTRTSSIALAGLVACAGLVLAACGQQTDQRVVDSSTAATQAPGTEAPATQAPATQAPATGAAAPAATSPYVTINCATGEQTPADAAPEGTTVGPVTVVTGADGVPMVTVQAGAAPATELAIADVTTGSGPAVTAENSLTVNYCGVGLGSASLFDSSWANGQPATFPLNGVIAGWQQGMPGMMAGGERVLVIPGELAYGENPPPGILPNETLVFVVDLATIS